MPAHSARFGRAPDEPGTGFVAYAGAALEEVLCAQADRQVGRDNCVSWVGRSLQIPEQTHRRHYVRAMVRLHDYPDGRLAIFDGPRCLARYQPNGTLSEPGVPRAA